MSPIASVSCTSPTRGVPCFPPAAANPAASSRTSRTSGLAGLQLEAAVQHEVLGGDEACLVGGEEKYRVGDVFRLGEALERRAFEHPVAHAGGQLLPDVSLRMPRTDGVDTDLRANPLPRVNAEVDHPPLPARDT